MKCLSPSSIKNPNGGNTEVGPYAFLRVRCGVCVNCVKTRGLNWTFRLAQESKIHPFTGFLTLTYDDKHLEDLSKDTLQRFFKRLRHDVDGLKYFACAEYGDISGRPHYHAILFGDVTQYDIVSNWVVPRSTEPLGKIELVPANLNRMAYVVGYVNKKVARAMDKRDVLAQKEWQLMSKGLGKSYLTPAIERYHRADLSRTYIQRGNVKSPMPDYYKNKIYSLGDKRIISSLQPEIPDYTEIGLVDVLNRRYVSKTKRNSI